MRRARMAGLAGAVVLPAAGLTALAQRDMMGSAAPPTEVVPRGGCVTAECHPGVKDFQHLHGPVNVNACDSCHELVDAEAHAYRLLRPRNDTCVFCHVVETPAAHPSVHEPFEAGDCLSCHDPHGGTVSALLRGERYADSCNACHEDVAGPYDHVHGPAGAGACGACHAPHSAPFEHLLHHEGREMCVRCHVTTGMEIEGSDHVHSPSMSDCRICHEPHASDHRGILSASATELCVGCHGEVADTLEHASVQHDAVTDGRACMNCHAAHASDHPALMKGETMATCFECHDREIELPDGSTLADTEAAVEGAKTVHGPIAEGDCTSCHRSHGGEHHRLLTGAFPQGVYAPYDAQTYALCFECHDRQLAATARAGEVTGFRNGQQNLHFVHVNRDDKGRSCRVCHSAHASPHGRLIRDTVPFGPAGWDLPIGFIELPGGGRCETGCHRPYAYDRDEPVDNGVDSDLDQWRGTDLVPGTRAEAPTGAAADEPSGKEQP